MVASLRPGEELESGNVSDRAPRNTKGLSLPRGIRVILGTTMSNDSREDDPQRANTQPTWSDDEMFCIYSYAGQSGPPCGWRGPSSEALRVFPAGIQRCPRCGRATLLEIPPQARE
jgi:hypothetical protein